MHRQTSLSISLFVLTLTQSAHAQVGFEPQAFSDSGMPTYSELGFSSCMFGDRVYFGAPGTGDLGPNAGAVYGYDMSTLAGSPIALMHPQIDTDDRFGTSIAARRWSFGDGNPLSVIVGAPADEGPNGAQGQVYFFGYDTGFLRTITAPGSQPGDQFGYAVGLFESGVVVGSPAAMDQDGNPNGEVHYYTQSPTDVGHTQVLERIRPLDFAFGASIAASEFQFIVGAPGKLDDQIAPSNQGTRGAVYVYYPSGELNERLTAPIRTNNAYFGASIGLGDRFDFVVGAPGDSIIEPNAGGAYFYENAGIFPVTIAPQELQSGDEFGHSVAINDNFIIVGAPGDDDAGTNAGAIYLFDIDTFELIQKIIPDIQLGDLEGMRFGTSLSTYTEDNIAVGASGFSDHGQVYRLSNTCPIDFDLDGQLNFFDVSGFLVIQPDLNSDGEFNFFDVSAFLSLYASGCN